MRVALSRGKSLSPENRPLSMSHSTVPRPHHSAKNLEGSLFSSQTLPHRQRSCLQNHWKVKTRYSWFIDRPGLRPPLLLVTNALIGLVIEPLLPVSRFLCRCRFLWFLLIRGFHRGDRRCLASDNTLLKNRST